MTHIFVTLSVLAILSLVFGKLYFFNHENRFIREKMTTVGVIIFSLYSVFSVACMFFAVPPAKPILVFCGFSPFIIGHFATFKKLNYYTVIQLLVFLGGIVYALGNGLN